MKNIITMNKRLLKPFIVIFALLVNLSGSFLSLEAFGNSFFQDYNFDTPYTQWIKKGFVKRVSLSLKDDSGKMIPAEVFYILTDTQDESMCYDKDIMYLKIANASPILLNLIYSMGSCSPHNFPDISKDNIKSIKEVAEALKGSKLIDTTGMDDGEDEDGNIIEGDDLEFYISENTGVLRLNEKYAIPLNNEEKDGSKLYVAETSTRYEPEDYGNISESTGGEYRNLLPKVGSRADFPPFLTKWIGKDEKLFTLNLPSSSYSSQNLSRQACKELLKGVIWGVNVGSAKVIGYRKIDDNYLVFYNINSSNNWDNAPKKFGAIYDKNGKLLDSVLLPSNSKMRGDIIVGSVSSEDFINCQYKHEFEYIVLNDRFLLKKAHWNILKNPKTQPWDIWLAGPKEFLKYIPKSETDYKAWEKVLSTSDGENAENTQAYCAYLLLREGNKMKKWILNGCAPDNRWLFRNEYILGEDDFGILPSTSEWLWMP